MRRAVAGALEVAGAVTVAVALFFWIPLVALAFCGVALIFFAQSVDGGK